MPAKIGRYICTHKEILISDTMQVLAEGADAASTVHCQHVSHLCIESNGVVGPHPSNGAAWSFAEGMAVGLIISQRLFWWQANKVDPEARHIILMFPIFIGMHNTGLSTETFQPQTALRTPELE